jgi:DNA-binding transcriptional regulator/RsmH inhibitor MraZ
LNSSWKCGCQSLGSVGATLATKGGSSFGNPHFDDADGVKVANYHIQQTTICDRVVIGGFDKFVKIWQPKLWKGRSDLAQADLNLL